MRFSLFRSVLCVSLLGLTPVCLTAADTASGMLSVRGTAWVNGMTIPGSVAVFPGDLVQTKADSAAEISTGGSSILIGTDSLVGFRGDAVELQHGTVSIGSSKELAARVDEISVTPASSKWTEFQVIDYGSKVKIIARKGDVSISDPSGTTTLSEGQEASRDKPRNRDRGAGATPAASGGILSTKTAVIVGAAVGGGVATWVLLQGDEPASPSKP